MVDLPRDKRKSDNGAVFAAAPEPAGEISGRDVLGYLRQHPNFLDRHPEALRLLRAPEREVGDRIADFQHFQIERLRGELTRVNQDHRTLIAASRGNLASRNRVHKAALAIIAAPSFEQLMQAATTDLAVVLDVDVATICVETAAMPGRKLTTQGIHVLQEGTIESLLGSERDALLCADAPGEAALFGGAAGLVRSQALLRLGFGRSAPPGLLCMGTRHPGRFHPGLSTELLSFLARVLGTTISQWLNPPRLG